MKKIFAIASLTIFTLSSFTSFAQKDTGDQSTKYITNRPIKAYPKAERYMGSPYENADFANGSILTDGKVLANNVALRYNVVRNEIEVKQNIEDHNRTAKAMVKSPDIYAKILNKTFVFITNDEDRSKAGYFIILHEGEKYSVYKKLSKEYIEGAESMSSLTRDIPAMYKEKQELFLVNKADGSLELFPRSRSGRFALFGDHKKTLKKYASENKLNINKDFALVRLVKHLDTL